MCCATSSTAVASTTSRPPRSSAACTPARACSSTRTPRAGIGVAESTTGDPSVPVVTLATAHPAKFPDAVEAATGIRLPLPEHLADLFERPERVEHVDAELASWSRHSCAPRCPAAEPRRRSAHQDPGTPASRGLRCRRARRYSQDVDSGRGRVQTCRRQHDRVAGCAERRPDPVGAPIHEDDPDLTSSGVSTGTTPQHPLRCPTTKWERTCER